MIFLITLSNSQNTQELRKITTLNSVSRRILWDRLVIFEFNLIHLW